MELFLVVFIPLFVAIDPIGALPLFLGLTEGLTLKEKRRLALQAVITALIIGLTFGTGGALVFRLLGITSADFKIGGGLLLVILSVREIFGASAKEASGAAADRLIGVVPIGIPLIAGPAMITTLLILHDQYNFQLITLALVVNLLIAWVLLYFSDWIIKMTGEVFSKVVAKIIAIFLAAIGIMMIRRGLEALLSR
ncbi:MAG: MarC family protein [Elusimicrobia bacterium]|nr:MarC family protein [Candidatus Obscuribacterium magneticum]